MQTLTRSEFLNLLGMSAGAFEQLQHAGLATLAFGTPIPATPGRYLDLDLVAMAIVLGLTPSLGRENAAAIVSRFFDLWLEAVGHAEVEVSQDFYVAVGGIGWNTEKRRPESLVVTTGTIEQIAVEFRRLVDLAGFFTVNVSDILRRLRARARQAGIDLSQAFFVHPADHRMLTRVAREREARAARLKRDERKMATAKARNQRRDMMAISRFKKGSSPGEARIARES